MCWTNLLTVNAPNYPKAQFIWYQTYHPSSLRDYNQKKTHGNCSNVHFFLVVEKILVYLIHNYNWAGLNLQSSLHFNFFQNSINCITALRVHATASGKFFCIFMILTQLKIMTYIELNTELHKSCTNLTNSIPKLRFTIM